MSNGKYSTKEYDADRIAMIMGAFPIDSGFADGSFVTIKRLAPIFTFKEGTDGEVTRSKTLRKVCEVRFKLMQSSSCNALMSALAALDENTPNGAGVGICSVVDLGGTTPGASTFFSNKAWIAEMPESDFDREAGTREWVCIGANAKYFVGGN